MASVDLNPIRPEWLRRLKNPTTPLSSSESWPRDPEFAGRKPDAIEKVPEDLQTSIGKLMPFANQAPDNSERAIPSEIRDYLELVDWSGHALIEASAAVFRTTCRRFSSG